MQKLLSLIHRRTGGRERYQAPSGGTVVWARIPGGTVVIEPSPHDTPPTSRIPSAIPPPERPVVFQTDEETLRRVADRLRALDTWHNNPALAPTGLVPASATRPPTDTHTEAIPPSLAGQTASHARTPIPC